MSKVNIFYIETSLKTREISITLCNIPATLFIIVQYFFPLEAKVLTSILLGWGRLHWAFCLCITPECWLCGIPNP